MTPFLDFHEQGILPSDATGACRLVRRAKNYKVLHGQLYHQSTSEVLLWCITLEEGRKLLFDIHGGIYEHHAVPRALVGKAFRHGFYWPTALADAWNLVKMCKGCQYYAKQNHLPVQAL